MLFNGFELNKHFLYSNNSRILTYLTVLQFEVSNSLILDSKYDENLFLSFFMEEGLTLPFWLVRLLLLIIYSAFRL